VFCPTKNYCHFCARTIAANIGLAQPTADLQFRRTELLSRMQRALVNAAGGAPPPSAATGMYSTLYTIL
jgi:hypothetical protein